MCLKNMANITLKSPSPQWDMAVFLVSISERAITPALHYFSFFLEISIFFYFYHTTNTHTYMYTNMYMHIYIYKNTFTYIYMCVYIFSLVDLHPGLPKNGAGQEH